MSIVSETIFEEHQKELKVLNDKISKLQQCLKDCASYLEGAADIIKSDKLSFDEDDDEDARWMIERARKLIAL